MTIATAKPVSNLLAKAYLDAVLAGERQTARQIIEDAQNNGNSPVSVYDLIVHLVYPTMELVQQLYRDDRISITQLNLATRLNRATADQLTSLLPREQSNGRTALIVCGNAEPEELGGQICADLFEARGWKVKFTGGGVPDDEILNLVGEERPDLLVFFATLPQGMPSVRKLIDYIRQVNAQPEMQIMCCGGIYKRAEGLAEEIGADLFAADAAGAVVVAEENPARRASVEQQTVGRTRRIKKAEIRRQQQTQRTPPMRAVGSEESAEQPPVLRTPFVAGDDFPTTQAA